MWEYFRSHLKISKGVCIVLTRNFQRKNFSAWLNGIFERFELVHIAAVDAESCACAEAIMYCITKKIEMLWVHSKNKWPRI